MAKYYAITHRNGNWEFICSGPDPDEVMQQAGDLIRGLEVYPEEEELAMEPDTERQLSNLRVVPEAVARDTYHIAFTPEFEES